MDFRLISLQKQLEARKLESFKLRKQQKKLRLENLKAKEQELLKQIELYDKKIEESKKSLIIEVEKKRMLLSKYSIVSNSSSKHFSDCIIHNVNNYENNHTLKEHDHCQNLQASDRITKTDRNKYIYPLAANGLSHLNILTHEKPLCEDSKESTNNHSTVKIDNNLLKSKPVETLIFTSIDSKENLKEEIHSSKTDEVIVKIPVHKNSSSKQDIFDVDSNSQELYFEKVINNGLTNKSLKPISFNSCELKKRQSIDINYTDKDVSVKYEDGVSQLEVLNTGIEKDQLSDYSTDFTSEESISEIQVSYKSNKNDSIIKQLQDGEQNNESSYEEERSEGEIMYEDKTFIEQYTDDCNNLVSKNNKTVYLINIILIYVLNIGSS